MTQRALCDRFIWLPLDFTVVHVRLLLCYGGKNTGLPWETGESSVKKEETALMYMAAVDSDAFQPINLTVCDSLATLHALDSWVS